jgi:predicted anti-sigma-YlaC factor YlaD
LDPCAATRAAMSARLDDEATDHELELLAEHLPGCAACRDHEVSLRTLARRSRLAAAAEVPDLSADIVRATADAVAGRARRRTERRQQLQVVLGLAAVVQVGLAVVALVTTTTHGVRDLAAVELALGLSFGVAAWRPRHAAGMVPLVALVAAASVVVGAAEVVTGASRLVAELAHLLPLVTLPVIRALAHDVSLPGTLPVGGPR